MQRHFSVQILDLKHLLGKRRYRFLQNEVQMQPGSAVHDIRRRQIVISLCTVLPLIIQYRMQTAGPTAIQIDYKGVHVHQALAVVIVFEIRASRQKHPVLPLYGIN